MGILSSLSRKGALLLLLGGGPALADRTSDRNSDRANERASKKAAFQLHYQAALQQYKKENFEQALTEFQDAYQLDPQPRLLFNIGQLHKKLGHVRSAIEIYELFLQTERDLLPKQREEVQRLIIELRGTDPALEPVPAALRPVSALELARTAKAGRMMANLGVGLGVGLNYSQLQATLQLEAGFAVLENRNGYIVVPLQAHLSDGLQLLMIPVGFHYDFMLPVRRLYIGARASVGYAAAFATTPSPFVGNSTQVSHFGVFIPEVSLKYVPKGRINLGVTPVSFPTLFNGGGAVAFYRFQIFAGANF